MPRYLVTSALPFANGRLHVGHAAGAYLPADIYVRYRRSAGDEVRFVCGSDDHGVAVRLAAARAGVAPAAYVAQVSAQQAADFRRLGVAFDVYGGTHQPGYTERHARRAQAFFRAIAARGGLRRRRSVQLFDPQAGRFLPDRYVRGTCYHRRSDGTACGAPDAHGDQCERCGRLIDPLRLSAPASVLTGARPVRRATTQWTLPLAPFTDPIRAWLDAGAAASPPWRERSLRFLYGQLAQGLPERAVTRDLDWGVPVPLPDREAADKVLYVWFENLIGYVSLCEALCAARDGDARAADRFWRDPEARVIHFIGEDNLVFHGVVWPAILLAEGSYNLPWQVVANAFLTARLPGREPEKISKSRGTALELGPLLDRVAPDALRYYLTAVAPETAQGVFSVDDFAARHDAELLGTFGNFVHRTLAFAQRQLGARVPPPGRRDARDAAQLRAIERAAAGVAADLEAFRFRAALGGVIALARDGNRYLEAQAPWRALRRDPAACATTIGVGLQTVRALAVLSEPFLPATARRLATWLGLGEAALRWSELSRPLAPGAPLAAPEPLFAPLEAAAVVG